MLCCPTVWSLEQSQCGTQSVSQSRHTTAARGFDAILSCRIALISGYFHPRKTFRGTSHSGVCQKRKRESEREREKKPWIFSVDSLITRHAEELMWNHTQKPLEIAAFF